MADRQLVLDIISCADQFHADPVVMLATAMQESGAVYKATPGDIVNGRATSFGPFQHHEGGALGSHDRAWAESKAAVCERAQKFGLYHIKDGQGAYNLQRPRADLRASYIAKINGYMPGARQEIQNALKDALPSSNLGGSVTGSVTDSTLGNAVSSPLNAVKGGAEAVGNAVAWFFTPGNTIRVVLVLGGGVLITVGVIVVVKTEAVGAVASAVK